MLRYILAGVKQIDKIILSFIRFDSVEHNDLLHTESG